MPKPKADTIRVDLTKTEIQVLRGLIVRRAHELGHGSYQYPSDEPSALRRLRSVANKVWRAQRLLAGLSIETREDLSVLEKAKAESQITRYSS